MISEQVEIFTEKLIGKTNNNEMRWDVLNKSILRELGFPDLINQAHEILSLNEFRCLLLENSFFLQLSGGVVVLFRMDNMSGKDGSHYDEYAILIQIRKNAPVYVFDIPGLQEKFSILYMAILDQQNADLTMPDDLYNFMHSC